MIPKFKAFLKETKQIVDVETIHFELGVVKVNGIELCHIEDIILMQSTGMKDKNGVEIYEGDIVNSMNKKFRIIFDDAEFRADGINIRLKKIVSHMEVIGNVWENEGLLNDC